MQDEVISVNFPWSVSLKMLNVDHYIIVIHKNCNKGQPPLAKLRQWQQSQEETTKNGRLAKLFITSLNARWSNFRQFSLVS